MIEVRGFFSIVGIDRNEYAAAGHERGVVRNSVVGVNFVSPPVGERGSSGARGGDFVGDLVALQDMLESSNLESEFLGHTEKHDNFVFAIAVRVNVAFAFEDFDERF